MIYMVEADLPDRSHLDEWNAWYEEHIKMLLSIPGILSAQRLRAVSECAAPFMAIYTLRDAEVLTSAAYRAKAGPDSTGVWKTRMSDWHRRVLSGVDAAPNVAQGEWLAVIDRLTNEADPLPANYTALRPYSLDTEIVERGILLGGPDARRPEQFANESLSLRVFAPDGARSVGAGAT